MRRPATAILILALASVLLAGSSPIQADHAGDWGGTPPHAATVDLDGPVGFAGWTTSAQDEAREDTFEPGDQGVLHVAWRDMPGGGNATYNASVVAAEPANVTFRDPGAFETGNVTGNASGDDGYLPPTTVAFDLDDGFEGTRTLTVNVTVYEANTTTNTTGNTTTNTTTWEKVDEASLDPEITVKAPAAPPEGPPWLLIGGLVAAGGAALAGGAYVWRRRQGPTAPRRSKALQELEADDDAEAQQQVEQQREQERKSRELRILEAKAEDHREGIERARTRLDEGEITEHQFERIKERKEEALEDVLERIEEKRQDAE